MSPAEIAYLTLVVVTFCLLGGAVYYGQRQTERVQRAREDDAARGHWGAIASRLKRDPLLR